MQAVRVVLSSLSAGLLVLGMARPRRGWTARLEDLADGAGEGVGRRPTRAADALERLGRTRLARAVAGPGRRRPLLGMESRRGSSDILVGVGLVSGATFGTLALTAVALTPVAAVLAPIGFVVGARAPWLSSARRVRTRRARLTAAVPGMVEVLVAATQAGLGPAMAFRRTAEVLGGPMGEELRLTAQEIDMGVPWEPALGRLARRTDIPSIHRLVATLTRSTRLGTSVVASLRGVADDLRRERRARAEEMARKAPIKMLFPLVFLILPAFLLLTVGPVLMATLRSLS